MNAMGLLPDNAAAGGMAGNRVGLEMSGRVLRTGSQVLHFATGHGVIARVADGFSGRVIAPAHCLLAQRAGTKEKREYLRLLGIEHVFDSRSLGFYNHVMEVTGGRSVDIVLNSLTGRFIAQSLKCLAPFGRFVELGKSDIYRNI